MRVSLPEQVWLELKPAGFGSRGLAYLTDVTIRWSVLLVIICGTLLLFYQLSPGSSVLERIFHSAFSSDETKHLTTHIVAIIAITIFLIEWSYPVYFEVRHQGVTPGKKIFGLRVVNQEGLPVTFQASAIRTLLLLVDFLPACGFVAFVSMLVTKRSLRIGDLVSGTQVVVESQDLYPLPKFKNPNQKKSIALPLPLYTLLESYLRRKDYFTAPAKNGLKTLLTKALTPYLTPALYLREQNEKSSEHWFEEIYLSASPEKIVYSNGR